MVVLGGGGLFIMSEVSLYMAAVLVVRNVSVWGVGWKCAAAGGERRGAGGYTGASIIRRRTLLKSCTSPM